MTFSSDNYLEPSQFERGELIPHNKSLGVLNTNPSRSGIKGLQVNRPGLDLKSIVAALSQSALVLMLKNLLWFRTKIQDNLSEGVVSSFGFCRTILVLIFFVMTSEVLYNVSVVHLCTLTQIHALGGPVARHVASVVGYLVVQEERRPPLKIAAEVEQIPDDSLIPTLEFLLPTLPVRLHHQICCCSEELLCFALCLFVCLAICHCRAPESRPALLCKNITRLHGCIYSRLLFFSSKHLYPMCGCPSCLEAGRRSYTLDQWDEHIFFFSLMAEKY